MAAFKQFNTNQVVITPFNANKNFRFNGSEITASDVGIEYYQSTQGDYLKDSGSYSTGFTYPEDGILVFNNIKQLYYSNYLTQSFGDNPSTASLIPGVTPEYDSFVGITTGPRFDNYLQSSVTQSRNFSNFSATPISSPLAGPSIISIPSKLYGEKIPCGTFEFYYTSSTNHTRSFVYDDSEGNLVVTQSDASGNEVYTGNVGQIFYSQGMAIFTGGDKGNLMEFASNVGAVQASGSIGNRNLDSASISFSSSITIRENQYKCTVRDNEYTYTQNPSALRPQNQLTTVNNQLSSSIYSETYNDGGDAGVYTLAVDTGIASGEGGTVNVTVESDGTISNITVVNPGRGYTLGSLTVINTNSIPNASGIIVLKLKFEDITNFSDLSEANNSQNYYDFATGSYFSPYVTTIGLYNEAYQLVAVGKLAQPIPISLNTDTTFVVNFDT